MAQAESLMLDLIGVHKNINGETQEPFWNLSFRVGPGRIATMSVNDEAEAKAIIEAHEAAKAKGLALIFKAIDAEVTVATETDEDTNEEVPVVRDGTRFFRLNSASVDKQLVIEFHSTRPRGAKIVLGS
jgi:hypothetical protein